MQRFRKRLEQKKREGDQGFTLIELLVVITILGILAAITVFSVAGLGDRGKTTAEKTDDVILRTAEEAYYAEETAGNGKYGTVAELLDKKFITSIPTYNDVELSADKTEYTIVAASGDAGSVLALPQTCTRNTGPRILAASNTTTPFNYLQCGFIAANSGLQFTYGSSATFATTANTTGNTDVLFASADEANINKVIKTADAVAGGLPGTCTVSGSATCDGIGSTKTQYTTGRLVVFSCKSGGATLPPASGAPTCAAPAGGYLTGTAPATPADVVTRLRGSVTGGTPSAPTGCSLKLTIADPGPTLPLTPGTAATAPYGYAAWEALTSSASGGGGFTAAEFTAYQGAGCITYGSNVTNTQTNVVTGAAHMAMLPKSFVVSPTVNDTNNWTPVSSSLHSAIKQWAVVLNHGTPAEQDTAKAFLTYLKSAIGKATLSKFGYDSV